MASSLQAETPIAQGERVTRARIRLAMRQPFLASALMRLPIRPVVDASFCPTMATDGYHIYYNAAWCSQLSDAELRGVLAHELLHVLFSHSSRLMGRDAEIWNQACDVVINLLLLDQGFRLPEGGLWDHSYEGLTAEDVYLRLLQDKRGSRNRWGVRGSVEQGDILFPVGRDLLMHDDPAIVALRDADAPDAQQLEALQRELRQQASENLQGAARGHFQMEAEAAECSKIDWRALLRHWLFDRVRNDWSLYPFSKRHIHRGLMLPSVGVDAPGHIVFAIDTSGSMNEAALSGIVAELRAFRETFPSALTVLQADTTIQDEQYFEPLDTTPLPSKYSIKGRGGTDFRPVFKWLELQASGDRPILIFATDGFGDFPTRSPDVPVIWLVTRGGAPPHQFPFGIVITIDS